MPPKLFRAPTLVVEGYPQNIPFYFNFVYISYAKMNEKVVQFYAQKKFAEEYIQSCKYAIGNSKSVSCFRIAVCKGRVPYGPC